MPARQNPDIALVGAARSGTSQLAAYLARHPRIDGGTKKEPNYLSHHFERGEDWYDSFYVKPGQPFTMDASVSYTFPNRPEAVRRLAERAPRLVLYAVRDPVDRAVSHYQLNHSYFRHEGAPTFSAAMDSNPLYLGASDYGRWVSRLREEIPGAALICVPFSSITSDTAGVAAVVARTLGLEPDFERGEDTAHRNEVREFKNDALRLAAKKLRHSRVYPGLRRMVGPDRLRALRRAVTRAPSMPSKEDELALCRPEQRAALDQLRRDTADFLAPLLADQDVRLGTTWAAGIDWAVERAQDG